MSYGKNKQTYNNKQWEKYLGTKSISSDLLYNLHLVQFIPPQRKSLGTTPYPHPCPDLQFRFLSLSKMSTEKAMATHSSTPAWQIPWTEDPGRLQSMGSLGVGHDWATSLSLFTFHFHILEKEMATHSSVLAWRIPGTGEPGELPSLGSHRFGHDWSDLACWAEDAYNGPRNGLPSSNPICTLSSVWPWCFYGNLQAPDQGFSVILKMPHF